MEKTTKANPGQKHPNRTWGLSSPFTTWTEDQRVGETLRALREMRGFTPDEFANELEISRPYLANIEAGRKRLSNILLAKAAETLRVRQTAIMIPRADHAPKDVA